MRRFAASGSRSTSIPSIVMRPRSGTVSVASSLSSVDLPAPLGPSSPNSSPRPDPEVHVEQNLAARNAPPDHRAQHRARAVRNRKRLVDVLHREHGIPHGRWAFPGQATELTPQCAVWAVACMGTSRTRWSACRSPMPIGSPTNASGGSACTSKIRTLRFFSRGPGCGRFCPSRPAAGASSSCTKGTTSSRRCRSPSAPSRAAICRWRAS